MKAVRTTPAQKATLIALGAALGFLLVEGGLRAAGAALLMRQELRDFLSLQLEGGYRILCIGESTTFDGGPDSYPAQLEGMLRRRAPSIGYSVINSGLPGADTRTLIRRLPGMIRKYRPDMVIAMMGINDPLYHQEVPVSRETVFAGQRGPLASVRLLRLSRSAWRYRPPAADDGEPKDNLSGFWARLTSLYNSRRLQKLESLLEGESSRDPLKPWLHGALAMVYAEEGRYGEAERLYRKASALDPHSARWLSGLSHCRRMAGDFASAEDYAAQAAEAPPNPVTRESFARLIGLTMARGIPLTVVQYPMRRTGSLKMLLGAAHGVRVVDNEEVFKAAVRARGYDRIFKDSFGADFGHATPLGNRILASRVAAAVLDRTAPPGEVGP